MDGAEKLSFGVDRICAVIAPFDMVTSIPTIIPLLTADVRANINTIRTANDFIEGVKTRIRPSPPASPDNLQIAAVPTNLFGRVTGWCKGTISWVVNAVKRPISATIESREKQLIATASGYITDGVLKGGLGFLTSQALKVYLASFTGYGIELVFRGVIGVTSYTPEEVEAMAAWTRFCVQWTIYIALVNQSLKQWRDRRAEALHAVEHPVAVLMNRMDLSALRDRMRRDEEIIPTFE